MSRGSASAQTMEAEPPDIRYQAEPGNEYNHLGLLYSLRFLIIAICFTSRTKAKRKSVSLQNRGFLPEKAGFALGISVK